MVADEADRPAQDKEPIETPISNQFVGLLHGHRPTVPQQVDEAHGDAAVDIKDQVTSFLGRDLFWDPATEEGTLLIRWSSRKAWKSISMAEVETVQERFETLAREQTGQRQGNPFPLVFEGELLPQ